MPSPEFYIQGCQDEQHYYRQPNMNRLEPEHGFIKDKGFWIYLRSPKTDSDHQQNCNDKRDAHYYQKRYFITSLVVAVSSVQYCFITEDLRCKFIKEYTKCKTGQQSHYGSRSRC